VNFPFTHPDRILWADQGISKQELGDYYVAVAQRMLPHAANRPLSLLRCPDGVDGECFFARHAWSGLESVIRTVETGDGKPMLAIDSIEGVLELVQMGVLEIHVWGSKVSALETPDRLIFDLDPGDGVTWNDVKKAALDLKSQLEGLQLTPFLKASGGKGLHLAVPVVPRAEWEEVKTFCKQFAQRLARDQPSRYVAAMAKSKRKGRIFIDYLRNARGATAIAPYSTRARAGAPVAVPLNWDELPNLAAANFHTLRNIEPRLSQMKSDPWADFEKAQAPLPSKATRRNR
jgi:bifunctional non-homologous end joining protein LigD